MQKLISFLKRDRMIISILEKVPVSDVYHKDEKVIFQSNRSWEL